MIFDPHFAGLEFRSTSNGSDPDHQGGMSTCCETCWVREIVNGEPRPWVQTYRRSAHSSRLEAFRAVAGEDPYGDALKDGGATKD